MRNLVMDRCNLAQERYNRVHALEQAMSKRLRADILVPYFGGCMCRMHNCLVNFETGRQESPVKGKSHAELAQLARRYNFEQGRIWRVTRRLSDHFAASL